MCSHSPNRRRAMSRFPGVRVLVAASVFAAFTTLLAAADAPARVLRVAADPNNLPFSNQRGEGFENKLVELIAHELGARVEYTWWAQRRGFFRNTLKSGDCDLVAGVPHDFEMALTTAPYYRSSYVFVTRKDRGLRFTSLDDPRLRQLLIGVQMVGDDFANTPPAHALSARGITTNIRGYTLYGDYTQPNPPARIIDAVLKGDIDVACVWGPLAGYFARQHSDTLELTPMPSQDAMSAMPFTFDISVGVRRRERALKNEVESILVRKKTEIDALLASYGVPRADQTLAATSNH
jgi:mxaJ protein